MPRPREKRCLLRRAGDRRTHGVPTELGESHFRKTFPTVTYNQTHCIPTRLPTFPASTSTDTSLGGTSSPAAQAFFLFRTAYPSVRYFASKQTNVFYMYRRTVLRVRRFLTGIPRDTCKRPLVSGAQQMTYYISDYISLTLRLPCGTMGAYN